MNTLRPGREGPRLGAHELTSLDERLGLLLIVRISLVVLVVISGAVASSQVGFTVSDVGPISAIYLTIAAVAEGWRRSRRRGRTTLHRAILPLDAVYLAMVTTPAGGPRSQLVVLFAVQLIAVTLLASQRAGIRMALWDSFLFIMIPTLSLSGRIGSLLGVHQVAAPPAAETALAIMGFWVVALCTAFFSAVSERELRRSKAEMGSLAAMAAQLEDINAEDQILSMLLQTLVEAFPFRRGALWWTRGEVPEGLLLSAGEDETTEIMIETKKPTDQIAVEAWAGRQPLLVRKLDPDENPIAARLLPAARNVVAVPVQIDGGDSGMVLLEYGGNPLKARLPRRTLVMISQFAAHAALSLRNARLLAERERQAAIDGLTGIANRREFDRVLSREVSRAERTKEPLTVVVFDVDHFKQINDTRGHLAGDEVLRSMAQVLSGAVRDMDLVARYGGEEFALVLPRCGQPDGVEVIGRITEALTTAPDLAGVTVSAGLATLPLNAGTGLALVAAADEALYESKRRGRDCYTVSDRRGDSEPSLR